MHAPADDTKKIALITTADTCYKTKVEVTYPTEVGNREYSAKDFKGKNLVAKLEICGKYKPLEERIKKEGVITNKVIYLLLSDGSIIVNKQPDVIAPLTEEAARDLMTKH
jgi:hypothetical protein